MSVQFPAPVSVVADDLGMSPPVNDGILLAFEQRLVTNASLMANMPYFDDAVERVHQLKLTRRIGAHLNLTSGAPLTEPIRRCSRFVGDGGQFIWSHRLVWSLSSEELQAIYIEFSAQAEKIRRAGIPLSHLDSHQHVHISWAIAPMIFAVARDLAITPVRLARSCRPSLRPQHRFYNHVVNARLRLRGLTDFQHFGNIREVKSIWHRARGPVEIMVHPLLNAAGELCDQEPDVLLPEALAPLNLGSRLRPLEPR